MAEVTWRLPVYLLLDCSASMAGEPLEAVKQGIKVLLSELRGDVQMAEEAALSYIAFDSIARQMLPLTPVLQAVEPRLWAGGVSSLGTGLSLLGRCMEQEKKQGAAVGYRDWRPVVFVFSDGNWSFSWQPQKYEDLLTNADFVVCAAGAQVNAAGLQQLSKEIITLNTLSYGAFLKYCTCREP